MSSVDKQKQSRASNSASLLREITTNPGKVKHVLRRAMDLAHSLSCEIHTLQVQNAHQQVTINTLRGILPSNASVILELSTEGSRRFPHECVLPVNRAKRHKRNTSTGGDGAVATDSIPGVVDADGKSELIVVRSNVVQITLELHRSTPTGREIVTAEGLVSEGLDFEFDIKRHDGEEFDCSSQLEWKDGLKQTVRAFKESALQWCFHVLPLSSEMSNSSLYISVKCTTPGFQHISWTSPRFISKARRDPSRHRRGEAALYAPIGM